MKSIQLDLPDKLAQELDNVVRAGWFRDGDEVVRLALPDFLRRHRFELMERHQLEDIAWALQAKAVRRVMLVVCDTGPLLHLDEAGSLDVLAAVGEVRVPPAVDAELKLHRPGLQARRPPWLTVEAPARPHLADALAWQQAGLLDVGEADQTYLATPSPN